jgi:hypothetical protein
MPSELNAPPQTNMQSSAIALCTMHSAPFETIERQSLACPLNSMRRPKHLHRAYHVLCSMYRPKALRDGAKRNY